MIYIFLIFNNCTNGFSIFILVPDVLTSCAEFIENFGIVDGIYRLSGVTSNIQRLRFILYLIQVFKS